MAKGKLYEYAVLYHPKPEKDAGGKEIQAKSSILKPTVQVLATSADEVGILAGRAIPEEYLDRLEDVEIVVRPFLVALAGTEAGKGAVKGWGNSLDVATLEKMAAAQRRERTPDWNQQNLVRMEEIPISSNYTLTSSNLGSISYNANSLMNANLT